MFDITKLPDPPSPPFNPDPLPAPPAPPETVIDGNALLLVNNFP